MSFVPELKTTALERGHVDRIAYFFNRLYSSGCVGPSTIWHCLSVDTTLFGIIPQTKLNLTTTCKKLLYQRLQDWDWGWKTSNSYVQCLVQAIRSFLVV